MNENNDWSWKKIIYSALGVFAIISLYFFVIAILPVEKVFNPLTPNIDCFSFESCELKNFYENILKQSLTSEETNIISKIGSRYGTFGDMFGAINAFFTGLSALLIAYTIRKQYLDSQNQKLYIDQLNHEKRLEKFSDFLNHFELLKNKIISEYSYGRPMYATTEGTTALNHYITQMLIDNDHSTIIDNHKIFSNLLFIKYNHITLELLKFIEKNSDIYLDDTGKMIYKSFLISFSNPELALLAIIGLYSKNSELKKLIEKYSFFEFLDPNLPNIQFLISHYNDRAFLNNPFISNS